MSNKITANCPHCNYEISINESEKKCFCQGCEKKLEIKNGMAVPFSDEMDKYKKLVSNTAILSIGTLASKVLVYLLLPLYTGCLSPAEYSTADLISQTANLLLPAIVQASDIPETYCLQKSIIPQIYLPQTVQSVL